MTTERKNETTEEPELAGPPFQMTQWRLDFLMSLLDPGRKTDQLKLYVPRKHGKSQHVYGFRNDE